MYAIVEIAGKQYKVEKNITVNVDKLENTGSEMLIIDKVLFVSDGENVHVGQPYVNGASVKAKMLGEIKSRKVRGIKFKRRKSYTRTMGHRTIFSKLKIDDIVVK
jgi:large subunit ribosomal protein L21